MQGRLCSSILNLSFSSDLAEFGGLFSDSSKLQQMVLSVSSQLFCPFSTQTDWIIVHLFHFFLLSV